MAFLRVLGLPASCTVPPLMSMTGFMDSIDPSMALAPPMRPPFFRFSSVLRAAITWVRGMRDRTHVIAALNTLENLKKGGRIGGARAMLGSMLSMKPVIDISGGTVHEAGKPRTRKKAMHVLYERMLEAGAIDHVAVMHGGAHDIGEFLDLIAAKFPRESLRIGKLGAIIGTHGGAEIIGVSWLSGA